MSQPPKVVGMRESFFSNTRRWTWRERLVVLAAWVLISQAFWIVGYFIVKGELWLIGR